MVVWKATLVSDELGYFQRTFTSKMLKVWLGSFLLLIVKCERKEIN